ncbi:hypothetical protein ACFUTX_11185 [Microbacterium sp. NPDC057407]|uniref:hypothetical protein n=1 Tax=Microbacterium sp. NPDC057407 TaxID=3346120 RepID=UPI00366F11ED
MHEHIEALMTALARAMDRGDRPAKRRSRRGGPRRARGTFVPAARHLAASREAHGVAVAH